MRSITPSHRAGSKNWLLLMTACACLALISAGQAQAARWHTLQKPVESVRLYSDEHALQSNSFLTLAAVGDIMLGRGVEVNDRTFDRIAPDLVHADIAVGNLESLISEQPEGEAIGSERSGYLLFAPPCAAVLLQRAGFDLLGIANNHSGDNSEFGRRMTIRRLSTAGIYSVGPEAGRMRLVKAHGISLAALAFNAVDVPGQPELVWDREDALNAVRVAARQADVVVVMMHWGTEYDRRAGLRQRKAAAELAQAGADLILGGHPHVVQDTDVVERSNGRRAFVAYSLGNLIFDQLADVETRRGAVLTATFSQNGLASVNVRGVSSGPQPGWLDGEGAEAIYRRMLPAPRVWEIACSDTACAESERLSVEPLAELPTRQALDLTGDGLDERVVHDRARVSVYDGVARVWQSPPEWEVQDMALGDPNDDGRFEILLALRKADAHGVVRSHPFIIGYRQGSYRQVWGGSATADPLVEVELADLTGDGIEELITLDERCVDPAASGGRAACRRNVISVWRWNGWGFTLMWKSVPGDLRNIRVARKPAAELVIFADQPW